MDPWAAATLFACGWPTLLFSSRPFSNTLEACLLALTLYTYHLDGASAPYRRVRLGALFGLGCFVRFTFPAFALPLGLMELLGAAAAADSREKKGQRININVNALLRCLLALATGVLVAAVPMVLADSWFYARLLPDGSFAATTPAAAVPPLVLCPLNALRYNANPFNLAAHGLHPRMTHAFVNLPLLFSTLGLAALLR